MIIPPTLPEALMMEKAMPLLRINHLLTAVVTGEKKPQLDPKETMRT